MNTDQPKPATEDEWTTTADKDGDCAIVTGTTLIGVGATVQQTVNIVAAHNAALAAEREVGGNTAIALAQQITKLEDQLAAERERCEQVSRDCNQNADEILQLRTQLRANQASDGWVDGTLKP